MWRRERLNYFVSVDFNYKIRTFKHFMLLHYTQKFRYYLNLSLEKKDSFLCHHQVTRNFPAFKMKGFPTENIF